MNRSMTAGALALSFVIAGCSNPSAANDIPANAVGVDLKLDKVP